VPNQRFVGDGFGKDTKNIQKKILLDPSEIFHAKPTSKTIKQSSLSISNSLTYQFLMLSTCDLHKGGGCSVPFQKRRDDVVYIGSCK
jgi:hypothetical protein